MRADDAIEHSAVGIAKAGPAHLVGADPHGIRLVDFDDRAACGRKVEEVDAERVGSREREAVTLMLLAGCGRGVRADQDLLDWALGQGRRGPPPFDERVADPEPRIGHGLESGVFLRADNGCEHLPRLRVIREGRSREGSEEGREHCAGSSKGTTPGIGLTSSLRGASWSPTANGIVRGVKTILVVDDERHIVDLIRLYLEREGFAVVSAGNGEDALAAEARHDPDLVILDLMLPGRDGFDVCRELRRRGDTPILILTARDDDIDAIVGLELGADDYVTKPFNPRALMARVKAILRRTEVTARGGRPIEVGVLRIDPRRREATVADRRIDLRAREFDLLAALARDPGAVLTRDGLLEDVWGTDFPGETRTVDVHVSEVRKKLRPDGPEIETVRGLGYRLVPPGRDPVPGPEPID